MKKIYGLVGRKLSHSFSKSFFENKFQSLNIDSVYENFEIETITQIKDVFAVSDLAGLNVTIPYKEAVIPMLDELDESAKSVGAVNCIQIKNGKHVGYNTDVFGFRQMIKPFLESHHERALILGKGGAAKAVAHVLNELGLTVFFVTRNPKEENDFSYHDINEAMIHSCGIIVNTTPVGMFPDTENAPAIPYEFLSDKNLVVDLIYNPKETLFMKKAKSSGANAINGETMLHQQAEKSWEIWNS
ncbi:MAG: shikimate dehydrogenase [Crocinitomicaceae bacterium]|jgi:shikimate dehydrogenase|nr:shikimate dehydrogenase [Crocinitomicaceae bacterium]